MMAMFARRDAPVLVLFKMIISTSPDASFFVFSCCEPLI